MTSTTSEPKPIVPIACTLEVSAQADRLQRWRTVLANATGRLPIADGIRLSFPADPALVSQLAELAVLEHQCCEFFHFTLEVASTTEVIFEVDAPPDALEVVTALFGSA